MKLVEPNEPDVREKITTSIKKTGLMLSVSITLFFLTFYIANYVYLGIGGIIGTSLGQTAFASTLLGIFMSCTILSAVITYNRYMEMMGIIHGFLDDYEELRGQVEKEEEEEGSREEKS